MQSRRAETIDAAAEIIRAAGPAAVTSVAVAARLGITQSAVYRHVRDVDELRTIAVHRVVRRLDEELASVAAVGVGALTEPADFDRFVMRLTAAMSRHAEAFELVDRWRFDDTELGRGIRATLASGRDGIVAIVIGLRALESPDAPPLSARQQAMVAAHAQLIQDDVLGVARLMRAPGWPRSGRAAANLLAARSAGSWLAIRTSLEG